MNQTFELPVRRYNKFMFAGHLRTPVLSEVLSNLALLRSQLSANGPENILVIAEHTSIHFVNDS